MAETPTLSSDSPLIAEMKAYKDCVQAENKTLRAVLSAAFLENAKLKARCLNGASFHRPIRSSHVTAYANSSMARSSADSTMAATPNSVRVAAAQMTSINDITSNFSTSPTAAEVTVDAEVPTVAYLLCCNGGGARGGGGSHLVPVDVDQFDLPMKLRKDVGDDRGGFFGERSKLSRRITNDR
ncbi:hypothetical protein V6N12_005783 [Hibiscus sabdariffa]|uniref:Uncharacterized protein n=1 Tax=Hibiscus sabdariffa TaxID=183260 RepID=A0ABR2ATE6_9ROSI